MQVQVQFQVQVRVVAVIVACVQPGAAAARARRRVQLLLPARPAHRRRGEPRAERRAHCGRVRRGAQHRLGLPRDDECLALTSRARARHQRARHARPRGADVRFVYCYPPRADSYVSHEHDSRRMHSRTRIVWTSNYPPIVCSHVSTLLSSIRETDAQRLQDEYRSLVEGLRNSHSNSASASRNRETDQMLANPGTVAFHLLALVQ